MKEIFYKVDKLTVFKRVGRGTISFKPEELFFEQAKTNINRIKNEAFLNTDVTQSLPEESVLYGIDYTIDIFDDKMIYTQSFKHTFTYDVLFCRLGKYKAIIKPEDSSIKLFKYVSANVVFPKIKSNITLLQFNA